MSRPASAAVVSASRRSSLVTAATPSKAPRHRLLRLSRCSQESTFSSNCLTSSGCTRIARAISKTSSLSSSSHPSRSEMARAMHPPPLPYSLATVSTRNTSPRLFVPRSRASGAVQPKPYLSAPAARIQTCSPVVYPGRRGCILVAVRSQRASLALGEACLGYGRENGFRFAAPSRSAWRSTARRFAGSSTPKQNEVLIACTRTF